MLWLHNGERLRGCVVGWLMWRCLDRLPKINWGVYSCFFNPVTVLHTKDSLMITLIVILALPFTLFYISHTKHLPKVVVSILFGLYLECLVDDAYVVSFPLCRWLKDLQPGLRPADRMPLEKQLSRFMTVVGPELSEKMVYSLG